MDVFKAVQNYITKMTSEVTGMKVLLLDKETTSIISAVFTQSQLLSKEIYLIDRIDNQQRDKMRHIKCISFCRPTQQSVQFVIDELRDPCYGEYYLYFSNALQKSTIERLAEADVHECVREVQEYFADYIAVNHDLFQLGVSAPTQPLYAELTPTWNQNTLSRVTEGITSCLLSLKKKPLIRYERNSTFCRKLAQEVLYSIQTEGPLYDFKKPDTPPIVLLLDRRNDPITPLLNQWTYQAMIHEILGIDNGRVDLSHVPGINPENKQVVLSVEHDPFYKANMFLNLGDLGANIKSYVSEYQSKHHSTKNIESISDMKKFVEEYPDFQKLSGNVSKHVSLVSELSSRVDKGKLLEYGELEQTLACTESFDQHSKQLTKIVSDSQVDDDTKLRLILLYALRYEKTQGNQIQTFVNLLKQSNTDPQKIQLVEDMLVYSPASFRLEDIFLNNDLLARTKNVLKGLKGVENVYTQHSPRLVQILNDLVKGKLKDTDYPFFEGMTRDKPQDVFVFIVGGVTLAEAREVSLFNQQNAGTRIVLGGNCIINTREYLS
ncbi:Sec1-like protein [Gorgonomyces haynaldii]|nr:Sec1-like protein [Gorgonomyces haynaldii]